MKPRINQVLGYYVSRDDQERFVSMVENWLKVLFDDEIKVTYGNLNALLFTLENRIRRTIVQEETKEYNWNVIFIKQTIAKFLNKENKLHIIIGE